MEVCAKNGCTLPVYVEPRTHISHKYCGRTHAMEVEGQRLRPPHGICHTCNLSGCKRPVAFVAATGRVHDFCSKAHADKAIRCGQWPSPQRSWSTKVAPFSSSGSSCCLPGCPLAVYSDGSSKAYDYCGRTHAIEHKQRISLQKSSSGSSLSLFSSTFKQSPTPAANAYNAAYEVEDGDDDAAELERAILLSQGETSSVLIRGDEPFKQGIASFSMSDSEVYELDEALARSIQDQEEEFAQAVGPIPKKQTFDVEWPCPICTSPNLPSNSFCSVCSSPQQATTAVGAVQSPAEEYIYSCEEEQVEAYWDQREAEKRHPAMWLCGSCQSVNDSSALSCPQCLEPAAVAADHTHVHSQQLRPSSSSFSSSSLSPSSWECRRCTFDNIGSDLLCFMCGSDVPESFASRRRTEEEALRPSECGIPGCIQRVSYYGFCSRTHFQLAVEKKILPPSERGVEVVLLGETGDFTAHLLRTSHPRHASVKSQFLNSWKKMDDGFPTVERIFFIHVRPEVRERYDAARIALGNVVRSFHGTSQLASCQFGTNQSCSPCSRVECRVCSICRNGFKLSEVKRGAGGTAWAHQTKQLRYGEGMYFSPVSSKSNDYNMGSQRMRDGPQSVTRKWRSMFLCSVVQGNPFRTKEGFLPQDQSPPDGFNSVIGEAGPNLNYEEIVVYDEAHALPSYLIVYSLSSQ